METTVMEHKWWTVDYAIICYMPLKIFKQKYKFLNRADFTI